MQNCDDVRRLAASIDGWLSDTQGCALFRAAAATSRNGRIVEIGSWKGRSTVWLAAGARLSGARVYAVDPHTGSFEDPDAATFAEFRANLARAGLADLVEPLVMTSAEAARVVDGPIELLFIDGDHSYEAVHLDAARWLPKLGEGGIVMFHDVGTAGYTGPRRVFRRSICWSARFEGITRIGSMRLLDAFNNVETGSTVQGARAVPARRQPVRRPPIATLEAEPSAPVQALPSGVRERGERAAVSQPSYQAGWQQESGRRPVFCADGEGGSYRRVNRSSKKSHASGAQLFLRQLPLADAAIAQRSSARARGVADAGSKPVFNSAW
jgi:predicted O-methyltransferase YrrM